MPASTVKTPVSPKSEEEKPETESSTSEEQPAEATKKGEEVTTIETTALFNFIGKEEDELSFHAGETLIVTARVCFSLYSMNLSVILHLGWNGLARGQAL